MKLSLGCDHGGYNYKVKLMDYLKKQGHEVIDYGCNSLDSCDYPDFALPAAEAVKDGLVDFGIVICSTGIGISIAANKVKGVRCGLCTSVEMAHLTKQHNNANVLALGGRTTAPELAMAIVDEWLDTEFEGGRHQRRVDMLDAL
jgi:ribose 5-phosphate isomerase B